MFLRCSFHSLVFVIVLLKFIDFFQKDFAHSIVVYDSEEQDRNYIEDLWNIVSLFSTLECLHVL